MSFGTLYGKENHTRTLPLQAIAKFQSLDVKLEEAASSESFKKISSLGKIPTFVGSDGYELLEGIAIAQYFIAQNPKTGLLGTDTKETAKIISLISIANMELVPTIYQWVAPLDGRLPYNKRSSDEAEQKTLKIFNYLENILKKQTFLVGHRISAADIYYASALRQAFGQVLDKEFRKSYPGVTRYFKTIVNQPIVKDFITASEFVDEKIKYTPPKKEAKAPKKEQAAPAKKEVKEEALDEEDKPAPKPKHPLEALGAPKLPIDEWKRQYSNNDTPDAMKWFWEHYDSSDYSLYRIDYKYNDELTLVFMSSNLISGLYARLEASRKYLFGSTAVYGEDNNSIISGVFLVRGQESEKAFDVAPDYESYGFKKLDASDAGDRKFVEGSWSWTDPVEGKELKDAKVFK